MDSLTTSFCPDESLSGQTIELSAFDQIAPGHHVVHLFFRRDHGIDNLEIFGALEAALLETVKDIPQIMCAVRKRESIHPLDELVYSPSMGARLTMRDYTRDSTWTHGDFDTLAREHFPMSKLERHLLLGKAPVGDVMPGLVVQANFIAGGLILSTCLHHTICDGTGLAMYLTALSNHLNHPNRARPLKSFSPSVIERTTIAAPIGNVVLGDFLDWKLREREENFSVPLKGEIVPEATGYSIYYVSEYNSVRLRDRLRAQTGQNYSATEALSVFLWMHIVRARNVDVAAYPECKLSVTVDARGRMTDPVLPSTYWGNFSEPNAVACLPTTFLTERTAGVENSDWSTTLPEAARRIKQAVGGIDNKTIRRLNGLLRQMSTPKSLTWNVNRWPGPDMIIVCLNKAPFNSMQYGPLGYSEAMRGYNSVSEQGIDGRTYLFPPRRDQGKSLDIVLNYDLATLARLKANRDFAEYCEWRN